MPHCCTSGVGTFRLLEFCSAGQISKGSNAILKHLLVTYGRKLPSLKVTGENCPTHTSHGRKLPHTRYTGENCPHLRSTGENCHTHVSQTKTAPHSRITGETAPHICYTGENCPAHIPTGENCPRHTHIYHFHRPKIRFVIRKFL